MYDFLINRELPRVELEFIVGFALRGVNGPLQKKNIPGTNNVKRFNKCTNR
jgi:hypothetical protein